MFDRKMFALAAAACALLLSAPGLAHAQSLQDGFPGGDEPSDYSAPGRAFDPNRVSVTVDNNSGSRVPRQLREERRQRELRRRGPHTESAVLATGSSEVLSAARNAVASAGLDCHVIEASNPGFSGGSAPIFETACADGPGYVLVAGSPPQSYDCFELAEAAEASRRQNPGASVGLQCELPANQNRLSVISGWARQAGVTCQVNNAAIVGKSIDNNTIYEVGCSNSDGYWLEKVESRWVLQDCDQVARSGEACRFTRASRD